MVSRYYESVGEEMIDSMKDEWSQHNVIHCPEPNCKGMLLQNPYYHEMKCGTCGKFWMEITRFVEADDPDATSKK